MIPHRDLSIISNRLFKENGGRRIPETTIELDYALGWFLTELGRHTFGDKVAFKGGTALRRCHIGEYRFSEDLDFTLLYDDVTFKEVRKAFEEIAAKVKDATGMDFRFDTPDPTPHNNSHTFTMAFTGPMRSERRFKVDITISECVVGKALQGLLSSFDFRRFVAGNEMAQIGGRFPKAAKAPLQRHRAMSANGT